MLELFKRVSIIDGTIQEECVIVLSKKDLTVIPIDSEEYREAYLKYEIIKEKEKSILKAKDVEPGEILDIKRRKEYVKMTFLGRFFVYSFQKEYYLTERRNFIKFFQEGHDIYNKNSQKFAFLMETTNEKRLIFLKTFPKATNSYGKNEDFPSQASLLRITNLLLQRDITRYSPKILKDIVLEGKIFIEYCGTYWYETPVIAYQYETSRDKFIEDFKKIAHDEAVFV
jgi:hypothetical protein